MGSAVQCSAAQERRLSRWVLGTAAFVPSCACRAGWRSFATSPSRRMDAGPPRRGSLHRRGDAAVDRAWLRSLRFVVWRSRGSRCPRWRKAVYSWGESGVRQSMEIGSSWGTTGDRGPSRRFWRRRGSRSARQNALLLSIDGGLCGRPVACRVTGTGAPVVVQLPLERTRLCAVPKAERSALRGRRDRANVRRRAAAPTCPA
jgi:hypothetical protein